MCEFVFDLVEHLYQQEEFQQPFCRQRILWPQPGVSQTLAVGEQECLRSDGAPSFEIGKKGTAFGGRGTRAQHGGACGIIDRTQEAGNVACRWSLAAALRERA